MPALLHAFELDNRLRAYSDSSVAAGFMNQWKVSPGHNQNMLSSDWECAGVGVWSSAGGRNHDGVQIFGSCPERMFNSPSFETAKEM